MDKYIIEYEINETLKSQEAIEELLVELDELQYRIAKWTEMINEALSQS